MDVLLNYEDFHTTPDSYLLRNIYEADQKNRLFQDPDGIRLVSAIQLQTAMRLRRWIDQYQGQTDSIKQIKWIFRLYSKVPIIHPVLLT